MKTSSSFVVLGAALFLLYIGINTAPPLFEFYRRRFGVTPDELALLFSLYAMGTVVALPVCGSASDWWGRTWIIVGGLFCNSAGLLLLAIGGEFQILLAGARAARHLGGGHLSASNGGAHRARPGAAAWLGG